MSWFDTKQAAVDPDNPAANEQIPFSEWNAMVAYLKDKIVDKAVNTAAIGNDKVLVYKTATSTFVFEAQSAVGSLDDLTDVVISGVPADNEVVAYDTTTSKFINQTAAEAGLATTTQLTTLETAAVLNADYNATTFLYATADNTPLPKTPAETMAILSGTSGAEFLFNTQKIGGIVDPTTAQQASTKNYDDAHLFTKEAVTSFTDGYVPVYRTASGKFEMEAQTAVTAVLEADFDATTFLYATADNTPLPKTPAEVMAILSGAAGAEFLFNTQKIGGIVDPTTAQQAATKNYADLHLFTKEATTDFTDGYIAVYRTASGKFEMEAGAESAGLPVSDTTSIVKGSADATKKMRMEVDGLTAGVTRIMTIPDKDMTLCGTDDAMLLNGDNAMAGDIELGGNDINDCFRIYALGNASQLDLYGGESSIASAGIGLFGNSHATAAYRGDIRFYNPDAGLTQRLSMVIRGLEDPIVDIYFGLDMNDKVIADQKNSAASALSGTQKDIEIDIGGTPYYFTVYPTKA